MCDRLIGSYAWSNNAQSRRAWLVAVTHSSGAYSVKCACLPIDELLLGDGPLPEMRRYGHPVKAWQKLFAGRKLVFRRPVLVF